MSSQSAVQTSRGEIPASRASVAVLLPSELSAWSRASDAAYATPNSSSIKDQNWLNRTARVCHSARDRPLCGLPDVRRMTVLQFAQPVPRHIRGKNVMTETNLPEPHDPPDGPQGPAPTSPGTHEVEFGPAPKKRNASRALLIGGLVGAVVLVGAGGTYAWTALASKGAQPAEVIPSTAIGFKWPA